MIFAIEDILTDNIIHGSHRLYVLLAILFTSMNNHGKSPKNMLYGTIIPIPKVKGTTDKYHAITKSSVLLKLLEYIFLNKCNDDLCIADLQYGITKGVSTTSCTFIVQKVISYYVERKTPVYCTLLDASKAFDRLGFL